MNFLAKLISFFKSKKRHSSHHSNSHHIHDHQPMVYFHLDSLFQILKANGAQVVIGPNHSFHVSDIPTHRKFFIPPNLHLELHAHPNHLSPSGTEPDKKKDKELHHHHDSSSHVIDHGSKHQ